MTPHPTRTTYPSATFTCTGCGLPAYAGRGIFVSVSVAHATELADDDDRWKACSDTGGPFFAGIPAGRLEAIVRDYHNLDVFRDDVDA